MYLDGRWYSLTAREGTYDDSDDRGTGRDGPFGARAGTVAGHQGPAHGQADRLRRRYPGARRVAAPVDSGEMKVAFALYPVSMKQ